MNYKIERAIKKNKKYFIMFAILWLILTIVFVSPLSATMVDSKLSNEDTFQAFIESIGGNIMNPIGSFGKAMGSNYIGTFLSVLFYFSLAYSVAMIIGIIRAAPKHEYSSIEHGSSDWVQGGEQYRMLSKKSGIILAEDNYLPTDKRGNTNVMIVGRSRFW